MSSMNLSQAGKQVGLNEDAAAPKNNVVWLSALFNMGVTSSFIDVQPRCSVSSSFNKPVWKACEMRLGRSIVWSTEAILDCSR